MFIFPKIKKYLPLDWENNIIKLGTKEVRINGRLREFNG